MLPTTRFGKEPAEGSARSHPKLTDDGHMSLPLFALCSEPCLCVLPLKLRSTRPGLATPAVVTQGVSEGVSDFGHFDRRQARTYRKAQYISC
jgi:hypothetical protein